MTRRIIVSIEGIDIEIRHVKSRAIRIKVRHPFNEVVVSAGKQFSKTEIERFVALNIGWIKQQLREQPLIRYEGCQFGDALSIFGKNYCIKQSPTKKTFIENDIIYAHVKTNSSLKVVLKKVIDDQLSFQIERFINQYESRLNVNCASFHIRTMTSRWGTCHVKASKIYLNRNLIYFPLSCLEYVVIHELAHLQHANHSKEFYHLIDLVTPIRKISEKTLANRI